MPKLNGISFSLASTLNSAHILSHDLLWCFLAGAAKIMIKQWIIGIPVNETSSTKGQEEEKGGKKMMIKNQQPLGIIPKTDIVKALTRLE